MDAKNLGSILSGTAPGTLLYDQDIYPAIQKIGIRELYRQAQRGLCYRQNHQALEAVMEVPDALKGEVPPEEKVEIPRESHVKEFLAQLESPNPVLLHDAYDVEELTWMCDRLRTSERFGADNHLYLRYSSIAVFQQTLAVDDWRPVITSGKSVFLFSEKDEKERYGKAPIANPHKPSHLEIDEINEIVNSIPRGYSGSCFFNMVLDGHPYLLTIGRHGLSAFSAIYKVFCEGEIVVDAIEHLKKPKNTNEEKLQQENLKTMLAGKSVDRLPEFFNKVTEYLEPEKKYGIDEWFKAFYLANNTILGREFLQRIAPAIFYDKHGGYEGRAMYWFGFSMKQLGDLNERCLNGFKYKKFVGIVRAPFTRFGSVLNDVVGHGSNPTEEFRRTPIGPYKWLAAPDIYGHFLSRDDPNLKDSRHVRLEDLKLYPQETTRKLCEFLRIPWSETCLHTTINGEEAGVIDGTAGFDPKPIYDMHPQHLSTLDFYRVELLHAESYKVWGYKLRFYDGQKYSREDLKRLYDISFKVEAQKLEKYTDWPNSDVIKEFHEWIYQRACDVMEHGEPNFPPKDKNGNPMKLVEVLYPDLRPGQKLYE